MFVLRILVALLLATFPLLAEDSYELRLHRPVKAGDKFKLSAKIAVDAQTKTIFNADEVEEEKILAGCTLKGDLTVTEATAKGLIKGMRLKLSAADCVSDGEAASFFKAGDVIMIRHGDPDEVVKVNGQDPDETQSEIIDAFLYVHGDDNATDDELLGVPGKVKTGQTWPINSEAMLRDWVREGFGGLKAEDMKGSTTLSEITKLNGEPAARLLGEFKIENVGLKLPSLPEAIRAKRFKLELKDETEMPLDPAGTAARVKTQMHLESDSDGTLEQDDGKAVKVRVNLRQRCAVELTVSPVK